MTTAIAVVALMVTMPATSALAERLVTRGLSVTATPLMGPAGSAIRIQSMCETSRNSDLSLFARVRNLEFGVSEATLIPVGPTGLSDGQLVVPPSFPAGDYELLVSCYEFDQAIDNQTFTFTVTDQEPVTPPPPLLTIDASASSATVGDTIEVTARCTDPAGLPGTLVVFSLDGSGLTPSPTLAIPLGPDGTGAASFLIPATTYIGQQSLLAHCFREDTGIAVDSIVEFRVDAAAPTTTARAPDSSKSTGPPMVIPRYAG